MKQRLVFAVACGLLLAAVAPACSGDDDGDDDDASNDRLGPVEGSIGTGTLKLGGQDYELEIRDCRAQGATGTIFFAGAIEDEDGSVFGGAGVAEAASLGIEVDGVQYVGTAKLDISGSKVSHKGQILRAGANDAVAIEFQFECD